MFAKVCLINGLVLTAFCLICATFPKTPPTNLYLQEHKQMFEDFTSYPFIDMLLIEQEQGCPEDYEAIFNRVWNGTTDVCFE